MNRNEHQEDPRTIKAHQWWHNISIEAVFSSLQSSNDLLSEVEMLTTPLVEQMGIFAKWLTFLILTIAGLILLFGYYVQHHEFTELFMAVVGLSVAE